MSNIGLYPPARNTPLASLYGLSCTGTQPSQFTLADSSGFESIYVSKVARALERTGLLEQVPNSDDPRAVQLVLTDHGREVIVAAMAARRALEEQHLSPLGGVGSARTQDDLSR